MDQQTENVFVMALVAGCLRGMSQARAGLEASSPGTYPDVDDARMLDVAVLLASSVIEAHPDYRDAKRFGKAADMVRGMVHDNLKLVRRQSETLGRPMLNVHMQAAVGTGPIANDA
jgi:hypothetical protein